MISKWLDFKQVGLVDIWWYCILSHNSHTGVIKVAITTMVLSNAVVQGSHFMTNDPFYSKHLY